MKPNANPIVIGIIAGLVAAIGTLGSLSMPLFAQVLAMAALFMAGLGYGRVAGLVAVGTAAVALGVYTSSPFATVIFALTLLPAAVMSQLALLARPATEIGGPDQALAWYPLADIMLVGAVITAFATITLLLLQPVDALYAAVIDRAIEMIGQASPGTAVTPEQRAEILSMLKVFGPVSQSFGNMLMLFAGFYFAMLILAAMKRNVRPREDIRVALRMGRASIAVFFLGVLLMFVGGTAGVVGASFAGATGAGFTLAGFAVIHNALRDKAYALPALVLVYLITFLVPPVVLIVALAGGLANPRRAIALTPNKPNETTETPN
ncbi:MAG: YybS family protein [Rhizobium sp.]|nr:YybS family protein [Rhizobium sp.]MBX9456346.1 YybS family protein [Rhizobium sp.]